MTPSTASPRYAGISGAAGRLAAVSLLALLTALVFASPGRAAVTIGGPLDQPANFSEGCETVVFPSLRPVLGVPPNCTFWDASQTPRGRWVITRARVRTGPRVGPMVFTTIQTFRSQAGEQPAGIICCIASGESQVFTPAPNTVAEVPVRIPVRNVVEDINGEPVEAVDYLGITLLSLDSSAPLRSDPTANTSFLAPALRPPQQRINDGTLPATAPLVNADLEPDADGDGLGDETQDPCPGRAGRSTVRAAGACSGGGGGPQPAVPGAPVADQRRPRLGTLRLRGRVLRFSVTEAATVRTRIDRCTVRRKRGKRRRVCTGVKRYTARPKKRGTVKHRLPRKLRAGTYRVTIKATDAAGNRSKALVKNIRLKK